MSDLNQVSIIGRLTRDAELKHTTGGTAILQFSVAVDKSIPPRNDGGDWEHRVSFLDVVMFGRTAEAKLKNLTKGRQVAVAGEIQQDRWEKDGQQHSRVKILAGSIQILALPKGQAERAAPEPASAQASGSLPAAGDFEDDIPF